MPLVGATASGGRRSKTGGYGAKRERTSQMYGVPGKKSKNAKQKKKYAAGHIHFDSDGDDDQEEDEEEPLGMMGGLSSKRGRRDDNDDDDDDDDDEVTMPSLYTSDLGTKGVKKAKKQKRKAVGSGIWGAPKKSSNKFDVPLTDEEEQRRRERQARFSDMPAVPAEPPSTLDSVYAALSAPRGDSISGKSSKKKKKKKKRNGSAMDSDDDGGSGFVGTCQNFEKPYLRLTTFPKAGDVRPLSVLKLALEHIKNKYRTTEDFEWANEQFRSLRQDLTVQGLRNSFVLEVYETHARLALEEGQLNEFNQCQTMLKTLTLGLSKGGEASSSSSDVGFDGIDLSPGKNHLQVSLLQQDEDVADEFAGYRLLYALVQKNWGDVTKELAHASAMTSKEQQRVHDEKERDERMSSCKHAMLVTKAVAQCDYHDFFVLYENAPHLSCYLMDFLVQRMRSLAYQRIVAAYRPTISVEFFRETLRFLDLEETREFLKKNGAKFVRESGGGPPFWIDCKGSKQ